MVLQIESQALEKTHARAQSPSLVVMKVRYTPEIAIGRFLTTFAGSYLDYVPHLYNRADRSLMLDSSVEAVAVSYFAKCYCRPELMQDAIQKHSVALQETNRALSVKSLATQDDTIASVMLLALFSALSGDLIEASTTWTKHVNGARTLLNMRPITTLDGYVARNIVTHVMACVTIDCFLRKASLPPWLFMLYEISVTSSNPFQRRFWDISAGFLELSQSISRNEVGDHDVVKRALSLDSQAVTLLDDLPSSNRIEVSLERSVRLSPEEPDHQTIKSANLMRELRMNMTSIIMIYGTRCLSSDVGIDAPERESLSLQVKEACAALAETVESLCASVPKCLRNASSMASSMSDRNVWICTLMRPFVQAAAASALLPGDLLARVQRQLLAFGDISDDPHVSRIAIGAVQAKPPENWLALLTEVIKLCD